MYMVRNEAEVTLGRSAEFESTVDELFAIHARQPGFLGSTVLQSYGNPGRYTLVTRWTEQSAGRAAARSHDFKAFAVSLLGAGLIRPTRMTEAFESVFQVDADNADQNASTCETLIEWSLKSPILAPAFEAFSRHRSELMRTHAPGFVSSRLRRFLGNDARYLVIAIATDRTAARARYQVPEIAAHLQAHPYTEFASAPASTETFEVVKRYGSPSATGMQAAAAVATSS